MHDAGIDYGLGESNIDLKTGIRFGVINQNDVGEAWYEESEAEYGVATCQKCGEHADDAEMYEGNENWFDPRKEHFCGNCEYSFFSDEAFPDEPHCWYVDDLTYQASCNEDGDIFITKSPYYTKAQYCSPCAPGAVYIMNQVEDGPKGYCFGPEWFEGNKAPYHIWNVGDNSEIKTGEK